MAMATRRIARRLLEPGTLAKVLGLVSAGIGAQQIAAPARVAKAVGVADGARTRLVMRVCGVRELACAAGLVAGRGRGALLGARVAGDLADLALLRVAKPARRSARGRLSTSARAVAAITAIDAAAALLHARGARRRAPIRVRAAATVARPPEVVYAHWRALRNLPLFMAHVQEVRVTGERTSHWVAKGPAGIEVEWDAEIVDDVPGQLISWRSVPGTRIQTTGSVMFTRAPGDRGTEIAVELEYTPPAGRAGAALARVLGEEPAQQVTDDLRRLKQVLETGEVVRSDGAPDGITVVRQLAQREAQPTG